jgi:hypothetical protein
MTASEVTRELIDLVARAGVHEREVMHISITSRLPGAPLSESQLRELVATLPRDEQQRQLLVARRLVDIGQTEYGPLDPTRDLRDYRAEVLAEYVDAVVYLCADLIRSGRRNELHDDAIALMRRGIDLALRVEAA